MYSGHGYLCLSASRRIPTLLRGPRCDLGEWQGCPLVVRYWADLQSVHGFHCYDNIHVCKLIALLSAKMYAYNVEREMSASACIALWLVDIV